VTEVIETYSKYVKSLSAGSDKWIGAINVNKDMEIKLGSTILARIDAVRMSEAERQVAIGAMRDANLLVDGFVWVANKIEQIGERLFLRPSLKH
jgi:hypothetical protein